MCDGSLSAQNKKRKKLLHPRQWKTLTSPWQLGAISTSNVLSFGDARLVRKPICVRKLTRFRQ